MSRILFATYEFHPTTWGGCGVLLRHATDLLLERGHEIVLLLDVPKVYFDRFLERDHPKLSNPGRCRAYHADALCEDLAWKQDEISSAFLWKSIRFAHATRRLAQLDPVDFVEFFEYCGVGYYALVEKRFGLQPERPVLGMRVHNSVELIDLHEGTKAVDRERSILYGLERAGLAHSEATLFPSRSYADRYYLGRYALSEKAIAISEPPTVRFEARPTLPAEQLREIQFFGRIFEFKGVEKFVRAALLVLEDRPGLDLDFVLIGNDSHDGPGGTSYTRYLLGTIPERFRKRFIFTGHLDHEAVVERFGHARFAVFPNRFESFCYAAHEAYEAGVPMLVSDIPAFRNYLEEGEKAYYFDGSSVDLARRMLELIDEPARLERLECGGRLAQEPLGDFYEDPRALRPIGAVGESVPLELTVVVLVPECATDAHLHATLEAIRPQLSRGDLLLLAYHAADSRANPDATAVCWLGETRRFEDVRGHPVSLSELKTRDVIWLLVAGDEPESDFLALCRGALSRNPNMGFAGTWLRDADGALVEPTLDVVPERYPFDHGAKLSRCLVRTRPDSLFLEAFEAQAGKYGEIGLLWVAEEAWGAGALLPRAKLRTSSIERVGREPGQLAFLVQSVASSARRERIAWMALDPKATQPSSPPVSAIDTDRAGRIAWEFLDGKTLARLAARKLRGKLSRAIGRHLGNRQR